MPINRHVQRSLVAALAVAAFIVPELKAEVRLSRVFGDHMVLQQGRPIRVWGWADPGEQVNVELAGKRVEAKAGTDGKWRVNLPAMQADGKEHSMQLKGLKGSNTVLLKDILLGEVWICSGQSNMEWSVNASLNAEDEITAATDGRIRLFHMPDHVASPKPLDDPRGRWEVCSPGTVRGFSAVGYFFGRELRKQLGVPVGLVGTYWGGTSIERWTPPAGFRLVPSLKDFAESLELQPAKPLREASLIYNGMVHPLVPLSVRGTIWYQGEGNAGDGLRYEFMKEALVKGWRTVLENDDMAFYWVQLANYQDPSNDPAGPPGGGWGAVREGQRRALR